MMQRCAPPLARAPAATVLALTLFAGDAAADESPARSAWNVAELTLEIAPGDGPEGGPLGALTRAAAAWNYERLGPVLHVETRGRPAELGDGRNTVELITRGWDEAPDRLAVTRKVGRDGHIVEADILVNAAGYRFDVRGNPSSADATWDLQSLLTHELGHVLGMPHLEAEEATMFPAQGPGDLRRRDLSEDDVEELAALYVGGTERTPSRRVGGCAAAGGADTAPCLVALLTLFALGRARRSA